jgi:hypothetical protein
VRAIKIDVEGHQLAVLRGGVRTIVRDHPVLCIEIEQRHSTTPIQEQFAVLCGLGYVGFFLRESRLCPIREFSYEIHQAPYLPMAGPGYVNNFLFVHQNGEIRTK